MTNKDREIVGEIIELLAERLAAKWSDPYEPTNRLKRKAKRVCIVCMASFTSDISVFCDGALTCNDTCYARTLMDDVSTS